MTDTAYMTPGLIGLTSISGNVGQGIRLGQFLNGDGFSKFEHAFTALGDGTILEAEPGGAVIRPMHYDEADVYWCRAIYNRLPMPPDMPPSVPALAQSYREVGYSFLDYEALFLHRLRVPAPGLKEFIASTGHMICSQMADNFALRMGVNIFGDGRWEGYVTPGMLWKRDRELLAS